MATYTSNLNLKKPALDDDALITDINNNMDILDAAANGIEDALAIVANGNTHAAITSGQFVYVRNHNTLTEGLYVASSNIAANATLSSSNLAADSKGGLNSLSEQIANVEKCVSNTATNTNTISVNVSSFEGSAFPRHFIIETGGYQNQYVDGAIGIYRHATVGQAAKVLAESVSGLINSVAVSNGVLTVTLSNSTTYIRLVAYDK